MSTQKEVRNYAPANTKALRNWAGMSRRELVEAMAERGVHLPQTSLRRVEEGQQGLKIEEALALADIFEIDLEQFITEPLDGEEGRISALLRKYRSDISAVLPAVWSAMESRERLQAAVERYDSMTSPAKREAGALLDFDHELFDAIQHVSVLHWENSNRAAGDK